VVVDEVSEDLVRVLVDDADVRARLRDPASVRAALAELVQSDVEAADMLEPLYGFSFSTTMVACNSTAVNVFPSRVVLGVDCRPLAGQDASVVEAEVRSALAAVDATWDFEWISVVPGNASPYPSPLAAAITTVLRRRVPEAEVANSHCIGFTDAHWFRAAFPGVIAYNVTPFIEESYAEVLPRAHAADERILVRDLGYQAFFAEAVALELLK
jgi:acetylornithine deacetylase/succinyl-diaminopimelate desuccinylase-like protein